MQACLSFLVLLFSALLLLASPAFSAEGSAPSGEGVSPRCEAAIDKASGNYSRCLLKATAMYGKQGQRGKKFLAKQERCEINFNRRVSLAQDRYGEDQCTPYIIQIADRTATYAEATATEAQGKPVRSYLFVQNGTGGTLSETALTLRDVSSKTGWFTDRPYRAAGQIQTDDFVLAWGDGGDSFANDPPNAEFSCEVDDEIVNYVVELINPSLEGTDLTYVVESVDDQALPTALECDSDSHLFIDSSLGIRHVAAETLTTDGSRCQSYCGCYDGMERYGRFCLSGTESTPGLPESLCTRQSKDSCGGAVQGSATRHSCAWNVALFSVDDNSCAMSAPQYRTDEHRTEHKMAHWNKFINNECKSYCGCEGEIEARIDEDTNKVTLYCESVHTPNAIEAMQTCTSFSREGQDFCSRQPYCAWREATQSDQACSWEVLK